MSQVVCANTYAHAPSPSRPGLSREATPQASAVSGGAHGMRHAGAFPWLSCWRGQALLAPWLATAGLGSGLPPGGTVMASPPAASPLAGQDAMGHGSVPGRGPSRSTSTLDSRYEN